MPAADDPSCDSPSRSWDESPPHRDIAQEIHPHGHRMLGPVPAPHRGAPPMFFCHISWVLIFAKVGFFQCFTVFF
jgi:hypothetical protein